MDESHERPKASRETMAIIIAATIVAILCIVACAAVLITLILNAPW